MDIFISQEWIENVACMAAFSATKSVTCAGLKRSLDYRKALTAEQTDVFDMYVDKLAEVLIERLRIPERYMVLRE